MTVGDERYVSTRGQTFRYFTLVIRDRVIAPVLSHTVAFRLKRTLASAAEAPRPEATIKMLTDLERPDGVPGL